MTTTTNQAVPPWLSNGVLVFDIETDGLLPELTKIHCLSIHDPSTGVTDGYPPERVREGLLRLHNTQAVLCGHNVVAFDIPAIQKIHPWFRPQRLPLDTKVWAQLVMPDVFEMTYKVPGWKQACPPDLYKSQSLRAWGYRLGILKGTTPDESWQTYSPEMLEYCCQDSVVTAALTKELTTWTTSWSAVALEMEVAGILARQEAHGVDFDTKAAQSLAIKLVAELEDLKAQLQAIFPPWQVLKKRAIAKVNNKKLGRIKGQPYEVWETVEFNPNSTQHIVSCLRERYGWEPTVFTDKGNPQLDDEVLQDIGETIPEVKLIRQYKSAMKILGFISAGNNSWLNHVTPAGIIHGNVQGCGAGTRRMTHNSPNLGQVPSSRAYLGKECRALFRPPAGYVMLGVDADQLELRTLSHFLSPYDNGEYAHAAVHGSKENQDDIHWRNAKAFGTDRDTGKTVFYAEIYGAGAEKIGRVVTGSWDKEANIKAGSRIKKRLAKGIPALVHLREQLIATARERGFLYDLDFQSFRIRSEHSALNELNQRAGAILMKRAEVYLDRKLRELGLDFHWLLHVHDEWQLAVRPQDTETILKVVEEAFAYTTEFYKMKCPITGGGQVGKDWSETH